MRVALGVALSLLFASLWAAPRALAHGSNGAEAAQASEEAAPEGTGASPSEATPTNETAPSNETPAQGEAAPGQAEQAPAPPVEEVAPAPPAKEPAPGSETPPVKEAPAKTTEPQSLAEAPIEVTEPEKKGAAKELTESPAGSQAAAGSLPALASTPLAPAAAAGAPPALETDAEVSSLPNGKAADRRSAGHRGAGAGCGSLTAPITGSCTEGWLSVPSGAPAASAPLTLSGSSPIRTIEGTAASPRHHRASVDNAPSTPRPEPGPGGSGGISAAGGGSSSACSALASDGPILRIARIATRQLLAEQPSWRTPFFVLIPERPG
jgi:ribonuclease E